MSLKIKSLFPRPGFGICKIYNKLYHMQYLNIWKERGCWDFYSALFLIDAGAHTHISMCMQARILKARFAFKSEQAELGPKKRSGEKVIEALYKLLQIYSKTETSNLELNSFHLFCVTVLLHFCLRTAAYYPWLLPHWLLALLKLHKSDILTFEVFSKGQVNALFFHVKCTLKKSWRLFQMHRGKIVH